MRKKAAAKQSAESSSGNEPPVPPASRCSQTWAMLFKRVYEFDPLACPRCCGQMKVVAFIEPPPRDVIEKILRHCELWHPSTPQTPPAGDGSVHDPDGASDRQTGSSAEPRELTYEVIIESALSGHEPEDRLQRTEMQHARSAVRSVDGMGADCCSCPIRGRWNQWSRGRPAMHRHLTPLLLVPLLGTLLAFPSHDASIHDTSIPIWGATDSFPTPLGHGSIRESG